MKNLGIIGFPMYAVTSCGKVFSLFTNKFLALYIGSSGYCQVTLQEYETKELWLVHRLVAIAFIGDARLSERRVVNHRNGIKTDNRVSNLEWVTPKENSRHAVETGLRKNFVRVYRPVDDAIIHSVCKMLQDGWRNCDIASATGVKPSLVAKIRFGTHYPDISKQYDFSKVPNSRRKLSDEKVIKICKMISDGKKLSVIMRELKVGYATLAAIKDRKAYTHISSEFLS